MIIRMGPQCQCMVNKLSPLPKTSQACSNLLDFSSSIYCILWGGRPPPFLFLMLTHSKKCQQNPVGKCQNEKPRAISMFHVTLLSFLTFIENAGCLVDIHHPTEPRDRYSEQRRVSQDQTLKLNAAKMRRSSLLFLLCFLTFGIIPKLCRMRATLSHNQPNVSNSKPVYVGEFHKIQNIFSLSLRDNVSPQIKINCFYCFVFSDHKYAALFSPPRVYISKRRPTTLLPGPRDPANSQPGCARFGQWGSASAECGLMGTYYVPSSLYSQSPITH